MSLLVFLDWDSGEEAVREASITIQMAYNFLYYIIANVAFGDSIAKCKCPGRKILGICFQTASSISLI